MKLLIVVDMQKDFIDGALGTKEARAIVPAVQKRIEEYKKAGDAVIFTRDTHGENYLSTREGRELPVAHCIKGTPGWEIDGSLDARGCPIIDKPTFGSEALAAKVKGMEALESVELIGLCTDICVISNALLLKAAVWETPVCVNAACCAGVTKESHRNALEAMKACQIHIIEE